MKKRFIQEVMLSSCMFFSINSFAEIHDFLHPFQGAPNTNNYDANGHHTGVDYSSATLDDISSSAFGKITGADDSNAENTKVVIPGKPPRCYNRVDVINGVVRAGAVQDWSGFNYLYTKHLINTGDYVYLKYLHFEQDSIPNDLSPNRYIATSQYVGREGASGCITAEHLHFEVGKTQAPQNYNQAGINATYNPSDFISSHTYQNAIPLLRRSNYPTSSDFDVYGIANQKIYGFLNLTGLFQESSIVVRDFFSRANAENTAGSLDEAHLFLGGLHAAESIANISASQSYPQGDYLFLARVKKDNQKRFGYPVKFSFVNEGGIIVDNDQKNADADSNNDSKTEPAYNGSVGDKVPGYFLTADLQSGRNNAFAQWKPYKKGDYKIYVHIPEYGTTATAVKYVIKKDGSDLTAVTSNPVNQRNNADGWVQLKVTETNGTVTDTFSFDNSGYIGLSLSNKPGSANYNVQTTQKVAFDAVRFESTWISRYSTVSLPPSDWIPSSQVVSNGILKLPANSAPNSYFWSEHRLNLLKDYSASNFKLTAKVKNPSSEGGISAYDLCMSVGNSAKTGLGKGVCFMGASWAQSYTGIGGNGSWNTNRSQLVRDLSNWHTIALEGINNTLFVYYDNALVDQVDYTGVPEKFNLLSITGKGSHSIDSVSLSVNGQSVMSRDF